MGGSRKRRGSLPGFPFTMGVTLAMLALVVVIPVSALFLKAASMAPGAFRDTVTSPRVLASYGLSLRTALTAAAIDAVFGLVVAWVLVRYPFPGHRLVDALVDLPLALPTAVAGIVLTTLYAPSGWLGRPMAAAGVTVAFAPLGIVLALVFVGLPFVVRTLQPVLEGLDPEAEEAAASLGADRWQTFTRVVFPAILPAWLTGLALALARGLGEYGSVVFIAGNMPMKTEIAPLLIMAKLEQYDTVGATAVASVLLILSLALLLTINGLQRWTASRGAAV